MSRRMAGSVLFVCRWLVPLLGLFPGASVRGEEFYYVMVFGSQQLPPRPNSSHTFATFVRAVGRGPCAQHYALEAHTISWLPRTLEIRVGALLPEDGVNLALHATLRWALAHGQRISRWGPYQIDRELYYRGLARIALLQSGQILYKAIDTGYCADCVSNCIHAASSAVTGPCLRLVTLSYGETASYHVMCRFQPWVLDDTRTHDWVSSRLGLDAYPILPRPLEHPRSGPVRGPISALVGRD